MNNGLKGDPTNEQQNYPGIGHLIPTVETYTGTAAIPSAGSTTSTLLHGLSGVPQSVRVVLVCTDAGGDAGHSEGDEIGVECFHPYTTESAFIRGSEPGSVFKVQTTSTEIKVTCGSSTITWDNQDFDETKWQLKAYATYLAAPETAS